MAFSLEDVQLVASVALELEFQWKVSADPSPLSVVEHVVVRARGEQPARGEFCHAPAERDAQRVLGRAQPFEGSIAAVLDVVAGLGEVNVP